MRRKMPTITCSDRKENNPSAINIVGRSPGIVSGHCFSASDIGAECELRIGRQHLVAQCHDPWQVHAVPGHRRWRIDPVKRAVEPGPEVNNDRVGVLPDERAHPVVEHLRAQRCLAPHPGLHAEAGEVVVDLADHFIGQRVAEDRLGPIGCPEPSRTR